MRVYGLDSETYGGSDDPYHIGIDRDNRPGWDLSVETQERAGAAPSRNMVFGQSRRIPLIIQRNPNYNLPQKTPTETRKELMPRLAYMGSEGGTDQRTLYIRTDDDVDCFLRGDLTGFSYWGDADDAIYVALFEATDPILRSVATFSTTDNGGDVYALPELTITGGTACTRTRKAVRDNSGRGLVNYPVDLEMALASDSWIFVDRQAVAFNSQGWIRATVDAFASLPVDIYTGTGVANPLFNTLDMGTINPTTSDNTAWVVSLSDLQSQPRSTGQPQPARNGQPFQDISFGMTADATEFALEGGDTYARDYDSVMILCGANIASIDFGSALEGADLIDARIFVKARAALQSAWTMAEQAPEDGFDFDSTDDGATYVPGEVVPYNGTVYPNPNPSAGSLPDHPTNLGTVVLYDIGYYTYTGSIASVTLPGSTVAVAIGIEATASIEKTALEQTTEIVVAQEEGGPWTESRETTEQTIGLGKPRAQGTLTLPSSLTLNLSGAPTVSTVSSGGAFAVDGATVENATNGDQIQIVTAFHDAGLVIDCYEQTTNYVNGAGYSDIRRTNRLQWFRLKPGANTLNTGGLTVGLSYNQRYII